MSEHKTSTSNWTSEQKKLYWERRAKNLRGQGGYANVHQTVMTEQGTERIPIAYMKLRKSKSKRR